MLQAPNEAILLRKSGSNRGGRHIFRLTSSKRNLEKSLISTQDDASWLWGSLLDLFCPKYLWITGVLSND